MPLEPLQHRPTVARCSGAWRASLLPIVALLCLAACGKKGAPLPPLPRTPPPPASLEGTLSGTTLEVTWSSLPPAAPGEARVAHEILWKIESPSASSPPTPPTPSPPSSASFSPEAIVERLLASGMRATAPAVEWGGGGGRRERRQKASFEIGPVPGGSQVQLAVVARIGSRSSVSAPLTLDVPAVVPGEMREFSVRARPDGIRLAWSGGTEEARVELLRDTEPSSGDPVLLARVESAAGEFVDASARQGASYRYQARLRVPAGDRAWVTGPPSSGGPLLYRDEFPPEAPRGLSWLAEGNDVRLLWSPNREPDLAGYRVRRRLGEAEEEIVASVQAWEVTWVDSGVPPGSPATYRVTAFDLAPQANESEPSAPVVASPAGRAPGAPAEGESP